MARRKRKYSFKPKYKEKIKAKATIANREDKEDEVKVISRPKKIIRRTTKASKSRVSYRQVVYVGTADTSTVRGAVTGKKYTFGKDKYKMPIATKIDERDYPGIIALKGKGCARSDPQALFLTEQDWDLEIAEAKRGNS